MNHSSINTILERVTDERCPDCNRFLQLNDLQEKYCYYCTVIVPEDKKLVEEALYEQKIKKIESVYKVFKDNSLINPKLEKATFNNYEPPNTELNQAKQELRDFIENYDSENPQSLLIIGNYGTGKSHLAVATTKEFMKNGRTAIFIQVNKLLTKIKGTWGRKSEISEDDLLTLLATVDLLVIDDFGAELTEKDTNEQTWKKTIMNQIIDSRVGRATIFTTNFSIVDLKTLYGEREFSRMIEDAEPVEMYGDNYRLRKFKK